MWEASRKLTFAIPALPVEGGFMAFLTQVLTVAAKDVRGWVNVPDATVRPLRAEPTCTVDLGPRSSVATWPQDRPHASA